MNLQLPSEHQRLFVMIGVGVIALAGLFLVTRTGGESSSTSTPPPAQTSPAKPDTAKSSPQKGSTAKSKPSQGTSQNGSGSGAATGPKASKQTYLTCVQAATDTVALEKCQAFVP